MPADYRYGPWLRLGGEGGEAEGDEGRVFTPDFFFMAGPIFRDGAFDVLRRVYLCEGGLVQAVCFSGNELARARWDRVCIRRTPVGAEHRYCRRQ